ncbi:hypothetical protein HYDPIDRAFT_118677 [Hydnomerulius pinastri MD-312]|uniref:Uncharacterized protein n=1 Tax=Hydnomerulius pinastri MD-312 TaxID=994086 RepID=A0A0C9VNN6_9AGAM|nr:hypothetical protein HYDPIDRAFT_118677 [Hydnomerulius pinastri MD-312]
MSTGASSAETTASVAILMPTSPPSSRPEISSPPSSKVEAQISQAGSPSKTPGRARPSQKRPRIQFTLPSDEMNASRPRKKARVLMTTTSALATRSKEVEDLHSYRMLELARASYDAFVANERYRRLRIREIDAMRTIAVNEHEEATSLRKRAEGQIGEIRHMLSVNGTVLLDSQLKRFPSDNSDDTPKSSAEAESGIHSRSLSPAPSIAA